MASLGEMTPTCPISDNSDLAAQRHMFAVELDGRARSIEKQWKSIWVEVADICITMRDSNLWAEIGFHSFSDWLINACPTSRSMAYLAIGIREELKDISDDDLRKIPLGNAEILKNLPRASRSDRKLLDEAKCQPPRSFVSTLLQTAPLAHLERLVKKHFSASQWIAIDGVIEKLSSLDGGRED